MTAFTDTQLDALDGNVEMRKSERKNGRTFLKMDEADRSYKAVAEANGITEGRAGVYVRDYLKMVGKIDLAPRRGSGKTTANVATGNIALDNAIAQREQLLHEEDRLTTAITDAQIAADTFDADEYRAEVAAEFEAKILELTEQLTAWNDDSTNVAADSASQVHADLIERAEKTATESNDALANVTKQRTLTDGMIKFVADLDESAKTALKDGHADLFESLFPTTPEAGKSEEKAEKAAK